MIQYKSYPEYKDSGVGFIGKIPTDWQVKRLKYIANFYDSHLNKNSYEDQSDVKLCVYTDVIRNDFITSDMNFMKATATQEEIDKYKLEKGDLILTKSGGSHDVGTPSLVIENIDDLLCAWQLTVVKPYNINFSNYLLHTIQSNPVRTYLSVESQGVIIFHLNQDITNNIPICIPPKEQQVSIVAAIAKEKEIINELISKKKQFIKLLKERRAALITHLVTKGLNPNVELKDSGNKLIGQIPVDWKLTRLKYVANFYDSHVNKNSYEDQVDVQLCVYTDVIRNDFITSDMNFIKATATQEEIEKYKLEKGDLIITKSGGSNDVGTPSLVIEDIEDLLCAWQLTIVKSHNINFSNYLLRTIQSNPARTYLSVESQGVIFFNLNIDITSNIPICLPPTEQLEVIVEVLHMYIMRVDSIIDKTKKTINLLKERSTAFITHAVTGQIDLRI